MTSINEAIGQQAPLKGPLSAGVNTIDLNQVVEWTLYQRIVLPLDGFVFWVQANKIGSGALANSSCANSFAVNQSPAFTPALTFTAQGSLHHTTIEKQEKDASYSVNKLVFTSLQPVNDLDKIAPDQMYLANVNGNRYAFSSRSMWYRQAGLYHYTGDAVYEPLSSQIINYPDQLNTIDQVVSNSLPIWLTFNSLFPVFPSFLVPFNFPPPFATIHIGEDDTSPMTAGPVFDSTLTRWQLAKDRVTVTTYGVRNNTILDWLDLVQAYTLDNPGVLGVMNTPIPRDAKRGQVEIGAIAQKKMISFDANYYQTRVQQLSRQLIKEAFIDEFFYPEPDRSGGIGYFVIGESAIGIGN